MDQASLWKQALAHEKTDPDAALRDYAEYERLFPHAPDAEDAAWNRVIILRDAHRDDEMRAAAAQYVRKYPTGFYIATAKQLASKR